MGEKFKMWRVFMSTCIHDHVRRNSSQFLLGELLPVFDFRISVAFQYMTYTFDGLFSYHRQEIKDRLLRESSAHMNDAKALARVDRCKQRAFAGNEEADREHPVDVTEVGLYDFTASTMGSDYGFSGRTQRPVASEDNEDGSKYELALTGEGSETPVIQKLISDYGVDRDSEMVSPFFDSCEHCLRLTRT